MSSRLIHRTEPTETLAPADHDRSPYENLHCRQLRESPPKSSPGAAKKLPCARALYSFKGERPDELTFSKGVSLRLLRRVNAEWLEGELDSRIGIFPANYVTIEVGLPSGKADSDLANSGLPYARALHDFPGEQESDLPFLKGDLIQLVSWGKGGWLIGQLGEKEGMFPASYVDVIRPLPSPEVSRKVSFAEGLSEGLPITPFTSSDQCSNGHTDSVSPLPMSRARRVSFGASALQSTVERPTPLPRARSATLRSSSTAGPSPGFSNCTVISSHSPHLQPAGSSPPKTLGCTNGYTVLHLGTWSVDEGGSSFDEATTGKMPTASVSSPATSGQRSSAVSSFDSVYMNEEAATVDVPAPIPKPRTRSSATGQLSPVAASANGSNADVNKYLSSSLDIKKSNAPSILMEEVPPPVPPKKRHLLAASGAPHRHPPSPPSPISPSDEAGSGGGSGEATFSFQSAATPSHPVQKINERIAEVQDMISSQEKLIQSAHGLLRVTADAEKRALLSASLGSREGNLKKLHRELQELQVEKARIQAVPVRVQSPVVPEPPTSLHSDKKTPKPLVRGKVIQEMIETEKEYHKEVTVFREHVVPFLRECEGIECDVLFGNIDEVCQISEELITAMEEEKEQIGSVFVRMSKVLLEVYTAYCKNHNLATLALKKYMEDPATAAKLQECMETVRGKTSSWDLGSMIIKPVQRIMRYHLLLTQLRKETEESHTDMPDVQKAELNMKEVADAINEAKRRKELVERYTDPSNKTLNISKVNMKHAMSKKMDRFITAMTQFAGLRMKTVDSRFEDERQRFLDLQEMLKSFQRGVQAWLKEIKEVFDIHQRLTVTMVEYCADRPPRQLARYGEAVYSGLQLEIRSHGNYVDTYVMEPLRMTLSCFQEPAFLIHKRDQKLLDYDHVNHELERAKESEKISSLKDDRKLAKRTYSAMNQQLLEDLPLFRSHMQQMLIHLLRVFCGARHRFHVRCRENWKKQVMDPQLVMSASGIQDLHSQRLMIACQRSLLQVRSIGMSSLIGPLRQRRSTNPTDTHWPASSSEETPEPPALTEGHPLEVMYDFEAEQSSVELTVQKGDVVTLVAPHDQLGCSEWWLVVKGTERGYVPSSFLAALPKEDSTHDDIQSMHDDDPQTVTEEPIFQSNRASVYTMDSFVSCDDSHILPADTLSKHSLSDSDTENEDIEKSVASLGSSSVLTNDKDDKNESHVHD